MGAAAGCGGESGTQSHGGEPKRQERGSHQPAAVPARADAPTVEPAACPEGAASCRVATGEIVYVERVDPDGDGDAHFVIADPRGITARGLTAIDVRHGLRPRPLPGIGDVVSAAGPVQTGSYGQSQIHALELQVARR